MAVLEGRLRARAPGLVGQWTSEDFRLTSEALEVFTAGDREQPRQRVLLNTLQHVGFDGEKNECIVEVPEGKWRLQGANEEETKSWTVQIQSQSGVHLELDTLSSLPKPPYGDAEYQLSVRLQGSEAEQHTLPVRGKLAADIQFEDCVVRQRLFVVAPKPRQTPLDVQVLRRSAAVAGDFEAVGSFQATPKEASGGKAVVYQLSVNGVATTAQMRLKVKGWGEPLKKKPAKKLDVPGAEENKDLEILDRLIVVLDAESWRVQDLFRNKAYNPKYKPGVHEELSPGAIVNIFSKVPIANPFSEEDIQHLVHLIDKDGNGKLNIAELEEAVRKRKRGTLILGGPDEKPRNSHLDFHRTHFNGSKTDTGLAPNDPRYVLEAISKHLDEKRLRMHDVFRHAQYNPSYLKAGDEELDARELAAVLGRAGLPLEVRDVKDMMSKLDQNGDGTLSIDELEAAIRAHRRGIDVTAKAYQKTVKKPAPKRSVDTDRLTTMYEDHFRRAKKLEVKRELMRDREATAIQRDIEEEKARKAEQKKRARVKEYQRRAAESEPEEGDHLHKLYQDARRRDMSLSNLIRSVEIEAQQKLQKETFRPPSRTRRSQSTGALSPAKKLEARTALLYERGTHNFHNRQKMKEKFIAAEICELDQVGQRGMERGPTKKHHELHELAMERKKRAQAAAEEKRQRELDEIKNHVQQRRQRVGAVAPPDPQQIEDWHKSHKVKQEQRQNEKAERMRLEEEKRRNAATAVLNLTAETHPMIHARYMDVKVPTKDSSSCTASVASTAVSQRGFGHSTQRKLMGGELGKVEHRTRILEHHDHAIAVVNQAVSFRCGCVPTDGPPEKMRLLNEPFKEIVETMRLAAEEVEHSKNPGVEWLKNRQNQRLFSGGKLLEDPVGWHDCCEPDPIQQIEKDFDILLGHAKRAQSHLLGLVGPDDRRIAGNDQEFSRRWPPGSTWLKPRVAKMAQFAFNPGPKPKEAAQAKAFVRFAPSNKEDQYRQLLDLARVSLVFANASLLRAGLDAVLEEFEVVAVHNYYNPHNAGLVTHKRIDVYVVIQDDDQSFTPHICEIRLEELPFHLARKEIMAPLKRMSKIFCEMYENRKTISDPSAIRYLAAWSLFRTKERHALTVFRRHLANYFGSTAVAWRREFGNGSWVNFHKFRDICSRLAYRNRTCEFWQDLDSSLAGNLSLFTLDPDAVVLLARFYARLMGLVKDDAEADVEVLFAKLTAKSLLKQVTPGRLELHEFQKVLQPLGFSKVEADMIFDHLDVKGGSSAVPPATINLHDLAWLKRLPELVDLDAVMLTPESAATVVEHLRVVGQDRTTGRRARMPTMSDEGESNIARVRRSSAFLGISFVASKSFNADGSSKSLAEQLVAAWHPPDAETPTSPGASPLSPRGDPMHLQKVATGVFEEVRPSEGSESESEASEGEDLQDSPEVSASESGDDFMRSLTAHLDTDGDDDSDADQKDDEQLSTEDEPPAGSAEEALRKKLTASLALSDSDEEDPLFFKGKATLF